MSSIDWFQLKTKRGRHFVFHLCRKHVRRVIVFYSKSTFNNRWFIYFCFCFFLAIREKKPVFVIFNRCLGNSSKTYQVFRVYYVGNTCVWVKVGTPDFN